jgi:hypothetical protein
LAHPAAAFSGKGFMWRIIGLSDKNWTHRTRSLAVLPKRHLIQPIFWQHHDGVDLGGEKLDFPTIETRFLAKIGFLLVY